jgi:hypothetical protein
MPTGTKVFNCGKRLNKNDPKHKEYLKNKKSEVKKNG